MERLSRSPSLIVLWCVIVVSRHFPICWIFRRMFPFSAISVLFEPVYAFLSLGRQSSYTGPVPVSSAAELGEWCEPGSCSGKAWIFPGSDPGLLVGLRLIGSSGAPGARILGYVLLPRKTVGSCCSFLLCPRGAFLFSYFDVLFLSRATSCALFPPCLGITLRREFVCPIGVRFFFSSR